MGLNAVSLVAFQDLTDDEEFRNYYGILFDDGFILCLRCGHGLNRKIIPFS